MGGTQPAYSPKLFINYIIASEGNSVACILYGVYIVIAATNLSLLREQRYKTVLLVYTIVQLVLTTVYISMSLYSAPAQGLATFAIGSYGLDALSPWPIICISATCVLNTWASDGFLLYRCHVVCMGNMYAVTVPILLYLVTVGASLAWLVVSSNPGAVYSTHAVQVAGACYGSCSVATNIYASTLISVRFWMYRRTVMRVIESRRGTFYLEYIGMTLESALLYTVFTIVAVVVFALNSPLTNVFFPVLGMVQSIAPSLIIYRIARGISVETDYGRSGTVVLGSMHFAPSVQGRSFMGSAHQYFFDESGTIHVSMSGDDGTRDKSNSLVQEVKEDVPV